MVDVSAGRCTLSTGRNSTSAGKDKGRQQWTEKVIGAVPSTQWTLSLYLVGAACALWKIGGSFVKGVDQNIPFLVGNVYILNKTSFPPIFTRQLTPLTKLPPYFSFPLFFNLHNNRIFSLKKERSPEGGWYLSSKVGGEVVPDFDSRFGG